MNFLDKIWLIPLFPLFGAALMLLLGKKLDPQPVSEVAILPGVEPVYEHGRHEHTHDDRGHGAHHAHSPLRKLINIICPGMVLLSFIFSARAVWELSRQTQRIHEVIQFTWIAGLPFHMANGHMATFSVD